MMAPHGDSHVPYKRPRLSSTGDLANERLRLPIAEARQALVSQLRRLDTAIVVGETGSGKSTQVPQYLLDHVVPRGGVVCVSQPRRVAAIALASRVSSERASVLGAQVGYSVRFERALSPGTTLCFCTDGVLCREAISDPRLARYDVLVLDEVHERALHTDVALALARAAQGARRGTRRPLKLVVMTATPDVLRLRRYLNGAPVLFVRGRQRALELRHAKSPQHDYLHATLVTIFQVHREEDRGDILVFLTGQDEIEATARICRQLSRVAVGNAGVHRIEVLPLYSALPPTVQQRVFSPVSPDCRKVVLATNIAETSLTIPGIRYVIDSGVVKIKRHNADLGAEVLAVGPVAQSQAAQRAGRAGRDGPGICFRLYTHKQFMALSPLATPEIQRCDLTSVLLNLLAIGVPNVEDFDFMDRPSPDAIQASLQTLQWLGAVKRIETSTQGARGMQADNGVRPSKSTNEEHSTINGMVVKTDDSKNNQKKIVLTTLGRTLAAFPLDPQLAKALLAGSELSCLEEMLTFAAVLSVDSFFLTSAGRSKEGDQAATACLRFTSPDGDAPTLAAVFRAYLASGSNKTWCIENALNHRNLRLASEVRKQLRDICVKLGLKMSSSRNEPSLPLRALCRGLFLQAVRLRPDRKYESFATHRPVTLGPSSALRAVALRPVVLHHGLAAGGSAGLSMRRATSVKSEWLGEALPAALAHRWMI